MNKRLNVIENVSIPEPKAKSSLIPAIIVVATLGAGFWAFNHISGGCLGIHDILTYCQVSVLPTKL